jgi:hypothetical protein
MLLCAFFFSIVVAPWSTHGEEPYLSIFHGMLCLYLLGIALAVATYDGEVAIHGLQIFQALNALLIWGIGDLTITGDGP